MEAIHGYNSFRIQSILLSVILLQGMVCAPTAIEKSQDERVNIVIILVDDLGYSDAGFMGCSDILTPHIDRIAKNGVHFTNAYVSYPVCGPSRAGLITGRYQDRFGFSRNPLFAPNDAAQGLPLSEETLATVLSSQGYTNMAIGKWHLGAHESQRPLNRGFDEFFGFLSGGHRYFPEEWVLNDISEVKGQWDPYRTKLLRNNNRIEESEYLTDALSREAVDFIDRSKRDPFFMYLAYNAPHAPLQATDKYLVRYAHIPDEKRRTYAAMVSAVDDGVGLILDKLEALELSNNTIVFFLSDNGGPEKVNGSENDPLRGGKGELYEGGIRVPFTMQWPGQLSAGEICHDPIISLDIFSTAVHHSGAQPKNELDGIDLISYIQNCGSNSNRQFYWRKYDDKATAVRSGNYKLLRTDPESSFHIFDLSMDISESLSVPQSSISDSLQWNYDHWERQLMEPLFLGLNQEKAYNNTHPQRFFIEPY